MAKRRYLNNNHKPHFLFAALFILLTFAPNAQAKVFNSESFTLENGMEVIIIPNPRAPVVTHMVWYRVGAANEPQGLSGMAHYFEHLMFKGTKKIAPGDFSRTVKKLGGNDNAFTGQDYTAYFQSISVKHLEQMMQMEADRMVNLSVPSEHFASEKKVVLEERRQRTENDPRGLFSEQMRSALFVNHPYGTPVIGWLDEIKDYEWNDVKKFYDTWYAPNNAILIISGDVTTTSVRPMVERTYGRLKSKTLPPRKNFIIPPAIGQTKMTLRHESIHQPAVQTLFLAPSTHQNKQDSLALQVLEEIISSGSTTRLYKHLVVEQKKAISVSLSYGANAMDEGVIWLAGTPADDVTVQELEQLLQKEIQEIIQNGVTTKETTEAIQRLQDAAIYARDSLSGPAMTFGHAITTGIPIDDIENWPEDIATVTPKQIQAVTKKYLDAQTPWKRPPVTGYLLPLNKEENKK